MSWPRLNRNVGSIPPTTRARQYGGRHDQTDETPPHSASFRERRLQRQRPPHQTAPSDLIVALMARRKQRLWPGK